MKKYIVLILLLFLFSSNGVFAELFIRGFMSMTGGVDITSSDNVTVSKNSQKPMVKILSESPINAPNPWYMDHQDTSKTFTYIIYTLSETASVVIRFYDESGHWFFTKNMFSCI